MVIRLEGKPASQFKQLIEKYGFNKEMDLLIGSIKQVHPLRIKLKSINLTLDESDVMVCESLTTHSRRISLSPITLSGSTTSNDGHSHTINNLTIQEGDLVIENPLTAGDDVVLLAFENDQKYLVIDRMVTP